MAYFSSNTHIINRKFQSYLVKMEKVPEKDPPYPNHNPNFEFGYNELK